MKLCMVCMIERGEALMLTDTAIRRLKLRESRYLTLDGNGLYLLVCPNGRKIWTVRYWIDKKLHQLRIGDYPMMGLAEARAERDEIKNDARYEKKVAAPMGLTFGEFAREWYEKRKRPKLSKSAQALYDLRFRYLDSLMARPLTGITREEIVDTLHKLSEQHPAETVRRTGGIVSMIMGYALATKKIPYDPSSQLGLELAVHVSRPMPAATHAPEIGVLMRALESIDSLVLRSAIQLIAYTFVRSGEACLARWDEIDLKEGLWSVPAEHTKTKLDHLVPLSRQAVAILDTLRRRFGGKGHIFPSRNRGKLVIPSTLSREMVKLQSLPREARPIPTVVHGFRATASTVLNEHQWNRDVIEAQLGHFERNKSRRAYNRAEYLPVRIPMMQWYADYLDSLRDGRSEPEMPDFMR